MNVLHHRLFAFDIDSTLLAAEVIDELASLHKVGEEVRLLTHEAMVLGVDFESSLRKRVALLKGLRIEDARACVEKLPLSEGADNLVRALKHSGAVVGAISGGFTLAGQFLQKRLGLDFVHANQLEIEHGCLTGGLVGPVIGAEQKADWLGKMADFYAIPLSDTVAIGDGANDRLMLQKAGFGIGYHPKPILRQVAHAVIEEGGLEKILDLLPKKVKNT